MPLLQYLFLLLRRMSIHPSSLYQSKEEIVFVNEVMTIIKNLNTSNLMDCDKLENIINLLTSNIKWAWGKNTSRSGGTRNIANLWTSIGRQESSRIERVSRKQSKTPRGLFSISRFKRLPTKVKDLGSSWAGSTNANYQPLKLLSTKTNHVLPSTVFRTLSTSHLILLFINKLTLRSLRRLLISHHLFGYYSPKRNSGVQLLITITLPLQNQISCLGAISKLFSSTMNV